MLLYKFRSLENLDFTLDILVNERLYCSLYKDLNDPFEGQFQVLAAETPLAPLLGHPNQAKTKYMEASDVWDTQQNPLRICSLSGSMDDVRMWSFYGSSHQGIAIEIDFDCVGLELPLGITYSEDLPRYDEMSLANPYRNPAALLSVKTNHWRYENEYRVFSHDKYTSIYGAITRVLVGHRADPEKIKLLKKIRPEIPFVKTCLDPADVRVVIAEKTV
jgi:hypothetical protein